MSAWASSEKRGVYCADCTQAVPGDEGYWYKRGVRETSSKVQVEDFGANADACDARYDEMTAVAENLDISESGVCATGSCSVLEGEGSGMSEDDEGHISDQKAPSVHVATVLDTPVRKINKVTPAKSVSGRSQSDSARSTPPQPVRTVLSDETTDVTMRKAAPSTNKIPQSKLDQALGMGRLSLMRADDECTDTQLWETTIRKRVFEGILANLDRAGASCDAIVGQPAAKEVKDQCFTRSQQLSDRRQLFDKLLDHGAVTVEGELAEEESIVLFGIQPPLLRATIISSVGFNLLKSVRSKDWETAITLATFSQQRKLTIRFCIEHGGDMSHAKQLQQSLIAGALENR